MRPDGAMPMGRHLLESHARRCQIVVKHTLQAWSWITTCPIGMVRRDGSRCASLLGTRGAWVDDMTLRAAKLRVHGIIRSSRS